MRKSFRYLSMAALAVVGTMMSGCTGDVLTTVALQSETSKQSVTLTTTISLDGSSQTRALTDAGVKTFAVNDKIVVFYKNTNDETMMAESSLIQATDISAGGKKATITVTLDAPKASGTLRMIYPNTMARETIASDATIDDNSTIDFSRLDNQEGTLDMLASMLDLAVFDGTLTADAKLPDAVPMANRLAIGKFTIKDNGSDDITSSVKQLTINDGTNTYTIAGRTTPAPGPIYVAMLPVASKNFLLTAFTTSIAYKKSVTGQTLAANKIYPINVTMEKDVERCTPLTLEAINDGTTITFTNNAKESVKYKIDDGADQTIAAGQSGNISVTASQKVTFFGDNERYIDNFISKISCSNDCYIYGNIMSLVNSTDYATATALTGDFTFYQLFKGNTHIKNHESKALVLPATTLTRNCYEEMFAECANLTAAPALPATTLVESCYREMFAECANLTAAPVLPAMTLAEKCYYYMFAECANLTAAPVLPAMTLAEKCYYYMFSSCKKLSSVTCLATDITASNCLYYWLYDAGTDPSVTSRTLYVNSSMTGADWQLGTSGEDGKRWTTANYEAP